MDKKYSGDERRESHWHLDKKVPLSLIFAMLVQGAMVVYAIADIKKDVEFLKAGFLVQHDRDDRQDRAVGDAMALLRVQLDRIDTKLDRIVEARR